MVNKKLCHFLCEIYCTIINHPLPLNQHFLVNQVDFSQKLFMNELTRIQKTTFHVTPPVLERASIGSQGVYIFRSFAKNISKRRYPEEFTHTYYFFPSSFLLSKIKT